MEDSLYYKLNSLYKNDTVYKNTILPQDISESKEKSEIGKVLHKALFFSHRHKSEEQIVTMSLELISKDY